MLKQSDYVRRTQSLPALAQKNEEYRESPLEEAARLERAEEQKVRGAALPALPVRASTC
jgi:hypothetical protein